MQTRTYTTFSRFPVALELFLRIYGPPVRPIYFNFSCLASVMLPHIEASLLTHICLAIFLQSVLMQYCRHRVFLIHGRRNLYFKLHVHGHIKFYPRLQVVQW